MTIIIYSVDTGDIGRTYGGDFVRDTIVVNGGEAILEVEGFVDVANSYVANGELAAYPMDAIARKQRPPGPGFRWSNLALDWVDCRSLADQKAARWVRLRAARDAAVYAGFEWSGSTFDSDETSQNRIMGAVQLAQLNPSFSIPWTLSDNTVRVLSAADMVAVGTALGQHVAAQFVKGQALRAQIDACATADELAAITWA